MSDLVGNPEDRFSDGSNHVIHGQCFFVVVFSSYRSKITLTHLSNTMKMTIQMKKDMFFFLVFIFAETQVVGSR